MKFIWNAEKGLQQILSIVQNGVIILSLAVLAVPCHAQTGKASITGAVKDQSGAAVAGAKIVATNTLTGQTARVATARNGTYVIPLLPVGNYSITFSQPGFKSETRTGIVLAPDQIATVDVALSLGETTQSVQVSANAPMLQTTTGALEHLVSKQDILELPLNGRNPASLILLVPGSVNILSTSAGDNQGNVGNPNDTGASMNGARQGGVYYMLDGAAAIDPENFLGAPMPNPDATQEFQVIENNFDAQYGFAPAGVVSVVTDSGTNQWHGDAFEFLRNYALDAANFFSHEADTLKQNQFGGSLGGPLKHNKLFIFGDYQRTAESSLETGFSSIVPNNSDLNGDFSGLLTGKTTNPCGTGGPANLNFDTGQLFMPNAAAPFGSPVVCPSGSANAGKTVMVKQPYPGNIIPASSFSPISLAVEQHLPHTNAANGLAYLPGIPLSVTTNEFTTRVDYNLSDTQHVFGRVFYQDYVKPGQSAGGDWLEAQSSQDIQYVNYAASHVWTIKPDLLNNLVFSVATTHDESYPGMRGSNGQPTSLQLLGASINYPPASLYIPGIDQWSLSGAYGFGQNTNAPMFRRDISFTDSVSWMKGINMIVAGIDVLRWNYTDSTDWQASPRVSFDGEVTGNSIADSLLGYPNFFEQGAGEYSQNYFTDWAPYAQDTVRLRPNLTVNVGMRWEPYFPPTAVNGRIAAFRPGEQSTVYPNAPLGLVYPGDNGITASTMHSTLSDFSPRLGIAWQPHWLPNTSLRAAFGIFDQPLPNIDEHSVSDVAPFNPIYDLNYSQVGLIQLSNPWASFAPTNFTSPFPPFAALAEVPPSNAKFIPPFNVSEVFDPNFTAAKDQSWNFSVQHQIKSNMLVTVAYVGSETYHLFDEMEINPGIFAAGGARTRYPQFGDIFDYESGANSSYNALQISFQKRFSHGLQLNSNYTWSKCIDDVSSLSTTIGNPFDLSWNRGLCDMNFPSLWVTSGVWDLPSFESLPKWASGLFGNWEVSGIWTVQSGQPFSVTGGCNGSDNSLSLLGADRADLTGQPFDVHQGSESQWLQQYFNPAAFQCNAPGTFGDSPRNLLQGPGMINMDMGIMRNFPFKERYKLQFRWEMFNAFNTPHFGLPNNNPTSTTFGSITGLASAPRIMQAALKFYW